MLDKSLLFSPYSLLILSLGCSFPMINYFCPREEAQERLTELAMVAREAADMEISKPKTEVMVVDSDGGVKAARPTAEDYAETSWKHVCECGRGFDCLDSLHKHAARFCPLRDTERYDVEKIVDVRGT